MRSQRHVDAGLPSNLVHNQLEKEKSDSAHKPPCTHNHPFTPSNHADRAPANSCAPASRPGPARALTDGRCRFWAAGMAATPSWVTVPAAPSQMHACGRKPEVEDNSLTANPIQPTAPGAPLPSIRSPPPSKHTTVSHQPLTPASLHPPPHLRRTRTYFRGLVRRGARAGGPSPLEFTGLSRVIRLGTCLRNLGAGTVRLEQCPNRCHQRVPADG